MLSQSKEMVRYIYEDICKSKFEDMQTLMKLIIKEGSVETLKYFYTKNPNLIKKKVRKELMHAPGVLLEINEPITQLHYALKNKKLDMALFLLKNKKHITQTEFNATLQYGDKKIFDELLLKQPKLMPKNTNRILNLAAKNSNSEILNSILEDISEPKIPHNTLAHIIKNGHVDALNIVMKKTTIKAKSLHGFLNDFTRKNVETIKLLVGYYEETYHNEWHQDFSTTMKELLLKASKCGNLELVQKLVELCPTDHETNNEKNALHFACEAGKLHIIKYLVEKKKYNPNAIARMSDFTTHGTMHFAARSGNVAVVKYLHEKGVSLYDESQSITPFQEAVKAHKSDVIKYYLESSHGIPTMSDEQRKHCFNAALRSANIDAVKGLLDKYAEPLLSGNENIFVTLLDSFFPFEKSPKDLKRESDVALLIVKEVPADYLAQGKPNALHSAAKRGFLDVVKAIHKKNPDLINQHTVDGKSVLFSGVLSGNSKLVDYLIDKMPDDSLNHHDKDGNNILHSLIKNVRGYSIKQEHVQIVNTLLAKTHSSLLTEKNANDKTPHEILKGALKGAHYPNQNAERLLQILKPDKRPHFPARGFNR